MPETGPADLLRELVAKEPTRPLITFYDDLSGERVEFSVRTFDNWVSKTANLLVDGLDAQPGTRVVLALPPHWQTAVWLFACWSAGLVTVPVEPGVLAEADGEPDADGETGATAAAGAIVASGGAEPFADPEPYIIATVEEGLAAASALTPAADEVVGLSLHAFGGPLADCPPGVTDYAVEVRSYGDRFVPFAPADGAAPAVELSIHGQTGGDVSKITVSGVGLLERAREYASDKGIETGARVLTDLSFATEDGLFSGLLGPLAAGGSVIICRNLDKTLLDRRISLEHVTAIAGVSGWSDPSRSLHRII